MRTKDLVRFIEAREKVRITREAGNVRPWTRDPILQKYRFCNVHREDDRVTKWLRKHWYPKFQKNEDYWFAAIVARLLNLPESLESIATFVLPFQPEKFADTLKVRAANGKKNFNAAYIVSTNGISMDKVDYITWNVLNLIWGERVKMRPTGKDTLEIYHRMLMSFDGLGSFIAAQVIADIKYIPWSPLKRAGDWSSFAASGPGSRRGLNRVFERDVDASWREVDWRAHLLKLMGPVNAALMKDGYSVVHAQDLQNCLCEFDKYERARLGEGAPKQIYQENALDALRRGKAINVRRK